MGGFCCGKKARERGKGVGRVGAGVGTGKGTGKSVRTRLSKLPFSKLPWSFSPKESHAKFPPDSPQDAEPILKFRLKSPNLVEFGSGDACFIGSKQETSARVADKRFPAQNKRSPKIDEFDA